jgi:hypothetical protein
MFFAEQTADSSLLFGGGTKFISSKIPRRVYEGKYPLPNLYPGCRSASKGRFVKR